LVFKKSKCVFLQEVLEVLGREVRWKSWGPLSGSLKEIANEKPRNVKELRSLLGSVNWIRRRLTNIKPTYRLSNLLRKGKQWKWGVEEDQAFQDLKKAVNQASQVRVPELGSAFILVTDASEEGGGGVLLQEQQAEDGTTRCFFLGHWAWKWSETRRRYPAFERELLAGILLLASQAPVLKTASHIEWLTDAAAIPDFLKGEPPSGNPRRVRWWFFAHQFPLHCRYVKGEKNELADMLSRGSTLADAGIVLNTEASKSFARMDEALDLVILPAFSADLTGTFEDAVREHPEGEDLASGAARSVDGVRWYREGERLYRETRLCVPMPCIPSLTSYLHSRLGHIGVKRLWTYCERRFFFAEPREAKKVMTEISDKCETCLKSKQNRQRDRGQSESLPLPEVCGGELAIDLIYMEEGKVLFMCDTLSGFVQAIPCEETVSQEKIARLVTQEWVVRYGAPGRVTADNDRRWVGERGPWHEFLNSWRWNFTLPLFSRLQPTRDAKDEKKIFARQSPR
jgi:hypothetical protein